MPLSPLPAALLSHMISISDVPPPPLHNIPSLKLPKHINYGQLNALCHIRGQHSTSSCSIQAAHNTFLKQYPKIFLHKNLRMPKLTKLEPNRRTTEDRKQSQPKPRDDSHNIAVHVRKVHGSHSLNGPKRFEERMEEFIAILKKLPVHRTTYEHHTVWKMLKLVPDLTSQLTDDHLKTLSKSVISETWVKGSTVVGNEGFYVILKGLARPQTKVYKHLIRGREARSSLKPLSFHNLFYNEDFRSSALPEIYLGSRDSMLKQWNTFGTLEVLPQAASETQAYTVVTEDDCEILKIPAKEYAKIKSEKLKLENMRKEQLIRKCPYYVEWPTLSIYELIALIKWKKFPPGHVMVESGNIISYVAYINSGYCNIYKSIIGLVKLPPNKVKKIRKLVYMGKLKEKESFGEISILLGVPFTCTVITGTEVEVAIIEDTDLFGQVYYPPVYNLDQAYLKIYGL
ncbi:cyclic nucleotide-binding domain-containing protein 1 [Trichechus inunguis]